MLGVFVFFAEAVSAVAFLVAVPVAVSLANTPPTLGLVVGDGSGFVGGSGSFFSILIEGTLGLTGLSLVELVLVSLTDFGFGCP